MHIGGLNRIRVHEGPLRIGDKAVLGRDNTINCYLDIEMVAASLIADWAYICDFDHVVANTSVPIKDQGIVKSPVRIGSDVWLGTKVTVTRGVAIGIGQRYCCACRGDARRSSDEYRGRRSDASGTEPNRCGGGRSGGG